MGIKPYKKAEAFKSWLELELEVQFDLIQQVLRSN
jgi:hypothetical protein